MTTESPPKIGVLAAIIHVITAPILEIGNCGSAVSTIDKSASDHRHCAGNGVSVRKVFHTARIHCIHSRMRWM